MAYCISEVRHREFPDSKAVADALAPLGLSLDEFITAFRGYICPIAPAAGRGYGHDLAVDMKGYLARTLDRDGLKATDQKHLLAYSRSLNEHADFGLVHERSKRTVYVEIEFGPNYEKDLINFQIAAREGTLALAVLVLSMDPRTIDATFSSTGSFDGATRVIDALRPPYPLVVIGLRGSHAA